MRNQLEKIEGSEQTQERILVVSIGTHVRLVDVLEAALAGTAFETVDADEFLRGTWENRRLLFAISAEESYENALLIALCAGLRKGDCKLSGCVCAGIVDCASGGQAHLDTLCLLLAANRSGARVLSRPLVEGDRELRFFSGAKEPPFARYCAAARELVVRLTAEQTLMKQQPRVWVLTALEGGIAYDWRNMISRLAEPDGWEFSDIGEPDETILLCENNGGVPDDKTLRLLNGSGRLRILLASATPASELYLACLLEHACLRGNYILPPRAILICEGFSAVEVLANKIEMERVKTSLRSVAANR